MCFLSTEEKCVPANQVQSCNWFMRLDYELCELVLSLLQWVIEDSSFPLRFTVHQFLDAWFFLGFSLKVNHGVSLTTRIWTQILRGILGGSIHFFSDCAILRPGLDCRTGRMSAGPRAGWTDLDHELIWSVDTKSPAKEVLRFGSVAVEAKVFYDADAKKSVMQYLAVNKKMLKIWGPIGLVSHITNLGKTGSRRRSKWKSFWTDCCVCWSAALTDSLSKTKHLWW